MKWEQSLVERAAATQPPGLALETIVDLFTLSFTCCLKDIVIEITRNVIFCTRALALSAPVQLDWVWSRNKILASDICRLPFQTHS